MTPEQRGQQVFAALSALLPAYGFELVDPIVPYAQAWHESGGFASNLAVSHNNVYGMTRSPNRDYDQPSGIFDGDLEFSAYYDIRDGVRDYLERQLAFDIPNTDDPSEYIAATARSGYAADPDYVDKWHNVLSMIIDDPPAPFVPSAEGAVPLLLLIGALLVTK